MEVASIDGGDRTVVPVAVWCRVRAQRAHPLFANGILMAQPSRRRRTKLTGDAVPVAQTSAGRREYGLFRVEHWPAGVCGRLSDRTQLTMFGRSETCWRRSGRLTTTRMCGSRQTIVVSPYHAQIRSLAGNISLVDMSSTLFSPLTFGASINSSPGGRQRSEIFFRSNR